MMYAARKEIFDSTNKLLSSFKKIYIQFYMILNLLFGWDKSNDL